MLLEQTITKLVAMRLRSMAAAVKERLSRPDHAGLSFAELFGLVVDEWIFRENRRLARRLAEARFKERNACVEDIDYEASRGIKKAMMLELAQNHWLEGRRNLLITGPTGAGKSFLAQALGNQACRAGYSVAYLRLPKFLPELVVHRAAGGYAALSRRLARTGLLILDDWGIPTIGERERTDLLELIEDRHGVGSTIVTSQLPVAAWHAYLGGGIVSDAVCDRLLNNSQRIELGGESQRAKRSKKQTGELTVKPAT